MVKNEVILQKYEIDLFIKYDNAVIDDTIRQEILDAMVELTEASLSDCTKYVKINDKLMVSIRKYWSEPSLETLTLNKDYIGKYSIKDVISDKLEEVKENDFNKIIREHFSINSPFLFKKNIKTLVEKYAPRQPSYCGWDLPKRLEEELLKLFKITPAFHQEITNLIKEKRALKKHKNIKDTYFILDVIEGRNQGRYWLGYDLANDKLIFGYVNTNQGFYNYIDKHRTICFLEDIGYRTTWLAFDVMERIEELRINIDAILKYVHTTTKTYIDGAYDYHHQRDIFIRQYFNQCVEHKDIMTKAGKIALALQKKKREEAIAEAKNKQWANKIKGLNNETCTLEKNGIKFYRNKMEYDGIMVDTGGVWNFKNYFDGQSVDDIEDFNTIFNTMMQTIGVRFTNEDGYYKFNIKQNCVTDIYRRNKITMNIDNKEILLTTKEDSLFFYINGIRINKTELADCLRHILCYKEVSAYNKFLTSISKCSIKFHNALTNGITRGYRLVGYDHQTIELKMIRKKNKNFLVIKEQEFPISDTNSLIDGRAHYYQDFVYLILKCVTGITLPDIKGLVSEGHKRYETALKKAEELFTNTCKKFGVVEKTIDGKRGYFIRGMSGNEYLIEKAKDGQQNPVWQYDGNKLNYICIVDRSKANQVGKDSLVSRIYALANDKLIANDVHTLKV